MPTDTVNSASNAARAASAAGAPPDGADEHAWADALQAALLFAVDPVGIGGVALRAPAGAVRDAWLRWLREVLPAEAPLRRVPLHIHDARLLGGLDLAATLRAGRPVAQRGLLAEADGGALLLAMAERLPSATAARLTAVLDTKVVAMERDGLTLRHPARLGIVALDEGMADDEQILPALRERCAFLLALPSRQGSVAPNEWIADARADVRAARTRLPSVTASDEILHALCAAALALGIASVRAPLLALRVACAAASLAGRAEVAEADAALAARLVLAPRATQIPALQAEASDDETTAEDGPQQNEPTPPPPEPETDAQSADAAKDEPQPDPPPLDQGTLDDLILEAAHAAIPAGLLAALKLGQAGSSRTASAGRVGQVKHHRLRGRPSGVRRGEPRAGARLNVIETLRAAAPWQVLRRREAGWPAGMPVGPEGPVTARAQATRSVGGALAWAHGQRPVPDSPESAGILPPRAPQAQASQPPSPRVLVRSEDFHVTRYKQHGETTTVFVVDASGSSALHRLAEAKGAVELLLADCYVRRDRVAVLAFRGRTAELLLPPTRSLVRAKRSLAGLPGGGGTPLAAGIDAAVALADAIQRRGETPIVVLLTDGRGNIARDGSPGRQRAAEDAMSAARQLRLAGVTALLLDTSPQPQPAAEQLAAAMGAGYLPLPYAGAATLSTAVRAATQAPASLRGLGARSGADASAGSAATALVRR